MISEETARVAASWWTSHLQVVDKREAFRVELERLLVAGRFGAREACIWGVRLEVDYDPGPTLLAALHGAGIECRGFVFSADGILPSKTGMAIFDGGCIEVRLGRTGQVEHIAGPTRDPDLSAKC